ncbi:MAG: SpoIIE family protein phosphatase [Acidobacteria bacterium]|nr:SpoIIE family protein phosphatase [Acidobacteriota bacterium]
MPMRPALRSQSILIATALLMALAFGLLGWRINDLTTSFTTGIFFQLPSGEGDTTISGTFIGFTIPGRVGVVTPGSPADRAGVRSGDEIVAIEGIPLDQKEQLQALNDRLKPGDTVTYRLRRDGHELAVSLSLESPLAPLAAKIGIVSDMAVALTFLMIGGLVFWRRKNDPRAELFFLFSAAAATTYCTMSFVTLPDFSALGGDTLARVEPAFLVASGLLGFIGYFLPASFLHLTLIFPKPLPLLDKYPRIVRWIYLLPVVFILFFLPVGFTIGITESHSAAGAPLWLLALAVVFLGLAAVVVIRLVRTIRRHGWGMALLAKPGRTILIVLALNYLFVLLSLTLYSHFHSGEQDSPLVFVVLFLPLFLLLVSIPMAYPVLSCIALIFGYRHAGHEEKRQLRWPLWGTLVALSGSILLGLLYWGATLVQSPLASQMYYLTFNLGKVFYVLIPLSFAVGIFKYRLMDIDIIIRKTVIYAIVTGIELVVFLVLAGGVGRGLVEVAGVTNIWGIIVAILTVVALLYPLHNWARDFVDRRFFRSLYDYPNALSAIRHFMVENTDDRQLIRFVAETVQPSLRCRVVAVFRRSEQDDFTYRVCETIGLPESQRGQSMVLDAEMAEKKLNDRGLFQRADMLPGAFRLWQRMGLEQAVGIVMAGKLTGLVALGRKYPDPRLEEEDIDFLFQAADLLAGGLARLRVRQQSQDLEVAREIQRRMLPQKIPQVPGLTIARAWQPSRLVGGDYFDLVDMGDGTLGILIADVAGKGMAAALLMSNMQAAFRAMVGPELSPRAVVTRLNQVMAGQMAAGRFITLFYGVYNTRQRRLDYVNAGHCPPILLRRDGRKELLEEGGLITGVFANATYDQGQAQLNPGDCLVLFTDGITEAEDPDFEPFGEERLLELVRRYSPAGPERLVEAILADVREHSAGEPQDDLTLIVITVTDEPASSVAAEALVRELEIPG